MLIFFKKHTVNIILSFYIAVLILSASSAYAALSCSITTAGACGGTIMLRMSGATNAHSELPGQSTAGYANNVVCCSGPAGLGNSCSGNYQTIVKLSGVTNASVEKSTESNYGQSACLSSSSPGDVITLGYQSTNCTGYETTLFSMSSMTTNSHVGAPADYTNKVCGKVVAQSITFSIDNNAISFGAVTSATTKYANTSTGSGSDVTAFNLAVNTNASGGYTVYMQGDPPKKGANTITAIGGVAITPTVGTKAFGIRAVATGGSGASVAPYDDAVKFAYDATSTTSTTIGNAVTGDGVTTTYAVHAVATIDSLLDSGDYTTNITYLVTGNF